MVGFNSRVGVIVFSYGSLSSSWIFDALYVEGVVAFLYIYGLKKSTL